MQLKSLLIAISFVAVSVSAEEVLQPIGDFERASNIESAEKTINELRSTIVKLEQKIQQVRAAEPPSGKRLRSRAEGGKIVNGVLTASYPTAGALIKGSQVGSAGSWCTGTLIGSRTFLTAAHCVDDDRDPSNYHVFLQHGGIIGVDRISVHADYAFPHADLAVLNLMQVVNGIKPTMLNDDQGVPHGSEGTIVGYGRAGGLLQDYGIKRTGTVRTAACERPETSLLCWNFDAPVGLPGEDSNTCNADSGGPLYIQRAGADSPLQLAGVTSGGSRSSCLEGDHSYDVDVFQFTDWIQAQTDDVLCAASAGNLPAWGSEKVQGATASGTLDSSTTARDFRMTVPAGIQLLRIAMNAEDDGSDNFDLYVKSGGSPSETDNDCEQSGSGQYAFCSFESPVTGDWFIRVVRKTGAGSFQVTATMFEE